MKTSVDIITILPCEVRHYIWSYCDKRSLKVLSVCCKQMYAEVKPLVWKRVEVSWQFLEGFLFGKQKTNLHLISCLVLGARSRGRFRNLSSEYSSLGLGSFLDGCERLKSLTISDFLPAKGLGLVNEKIPQLEKLEMNLLLDAVLIMVVI